MAAARARNSVRPVLEATLDQVYAAALAACEDDEAAAEATRRVLVADPAGRPDELAARSAILAAGRAATRGWTPTTVTRSCSPARSAGRPTASRSSSRRRRRMSGGGSAAGCE